MDSVLSRVTERANSIRKNRDEYGWPEPRTVEDLRRDPRVQLRNRLDGSCENLEIAMALILVVAQDHERLAAAAGKL
jgi:hypothetical protein